MKIISPLLGLIVLSTIFAGCAPIVEERTVHRGYDRRGPRHYDHNRYDRDYDDGYRRSNYPRSRSTTVVIAPGAGVRRGPVYYDR